MSDTVNRMARPTIRLTALGAGICLALFAVAFLAAGGGASEQAAQPPGEVRVQSPAPERVVGLRSIGTMPALARPRPRKRATPARRTTPPPPAAVVRRPTVVRPPAAPPPPPPPPPPSCLGALC